MNNRVFAERLRELLLADQRIAKKPDGDVNVTLAAKAIGLEQPTLFRMLRGESQQPRAGNADKLTRFFRVTYGQLIGVEPLGAEDQKHAAVGPGADLESEFLTLIEAMDRSEMVELMLAAAATLTAPEQIEFAEAVLRGARESLAPL